MANKQSTPFSPEPSTLSIGKGTAELGEIVVFIDGRAENGNILNFAATLAQKHNARLISVFMQPLPMVTTAETFARGEGMRNTIEVHQAQLERIEADYRAQFEDVVRRHGIRPESEWRSLPYLSSEVGVHAYYADLVVVARPEPAGQTASPPGLAESLVMSSGRPIIVFPPRHTVSGIHRILVAWNATRESIRAVADAIPVLVKAKAVEVLVVDHQRRPEGHGQEPGADIARHLARHGAHVEVLRLSSDGKDVGRLLLSQAAAFGADLLVMGAYGHTHLREWMFGGVTRTVFYEAGLPVLMSR
ncbi:MAG TPA: universal stress protein [Candidatus Acidoferrales bacterium]|jgi:nucleotide-binding universal stress UspA family protein|nr:universal stress protein [Candidatus Acidoferrales bacterium]